MSKKFTKVFTGEEPASLRDSIGFETLERLLKLSRRLREDECITDFKINDFGIEFGIRKLNKNED